MIERRPRAPVSREPGEQILLYSFRHDRQLAEACLAIERSGDASTLAEIVHLQRDVVDPDETRPHAGTR